MVSAEHVTINDHLLQILQTPRMMTYVELVLMKEVLLPVLHVWQVTLKSIPKFILQDVSHLMNAQIIMEL